MAKYGAYHSARNDINNIEVKNGLQIIDITGF